MANYDIDPKYILHNSLVSSTSKLLNAMKLSEALDDVMIQYSQKMHDVATKGYVQYTLNIIDFKKQLKSELIKHQRYVQMQALSSVDHQFIENVYKDLDNILSDKLIINLLLEYIHKEWQLDVDLSDQNNLIISWPLQLDDLK